MKFGETFKAIRTSKGMTLKETAGANLSMAQLSRFENEQSMITVDILYSLLNNINTTPQEYYFLMGADPEKELKEFFSRIIQLNGSFKGDDELKKERSYLLEKEPGLYNWERWMILFIEYLLKVRNNEPLEADSSILSYLSEIENWGERELRIYALFGFVLPVDTTYYLMNTAIKRSQMYQGIPQDMKLLHTILTNNFSTFVYHDRLDYAKETLILFEKNLTENVEFVESHLNLLFNKGIFAFTQKEVAKGIEYCEQVLSLCEIFQMPERRKMYDMRYQIWKEQYDNPDFKDLTIEPGILGFNLE